MAKKPYLKEQCDHCTKQTNGVCFDMPESWVKKYAYSKKECKYYHKEKTLKIFSAPKPTGKGIKQIAKQIRSEKVPTELPFNNGYITMKEAFEKYQCSYEVVSYHTVTSGKIRFIKQGKMKLVLEADVSKLYDRRK
jgi:hypothetical protein